MEIFGGFMVMMSIISLFLAVVWLIMPFVVFAIKGKQERTLEMLEGIDRRLSELERHIMKPVTAVPAPSCCVQDTPPAASNTETDSAAP
jgi:hypothetical protein